MSTKSFVACELLHVLPILSLISAYHVAGRGSPLLAGVRRLGCVIDATAHPRQEVHPGSALYFRTDIGAPNILGLTVVSMEGVPWHASFYLGHNNDQGAFILSDLGDFLRANHIWLLSDQIFVPRDAPPLLPDPRSPLWHVTHWGSPLDC